jgi:hypothetical protein
VYILCLDDIIVTTGNGTGDDHVYNIYRNNVLIKSNHTETSYTDENFDPAVGHTWAVSVICPSGESNLVSVTKQPCYTTHTITATTGGNGTISPSGNVTVNHGANQTFNFTPNTGYSINQVLVNNVNNSGAVTAGSYTFSNVTSNHTIAVSFTPLTYTVTLPTVTGAEVEPYGSSSSPVTHGGSFSFTVTLEPNYNQSVITVKTNGITLTPASNIYMIYNITTNQVVTVEGVVPNVGIDENEFNHIQVYSFFNSLYIKNESNMALKSVEITDMIGRTVYQSVITDKETVITLSVANGIYNVRLTSQDDNFALTKILFVRK